MWLRLILCALIVAFCTAIGYLAAEKYRQRKNYFSQLSDLVERYLAELGYEKKPLPAFLEGCRYTGDFGKTMAKIARHEQAVCRESYLTEAEKTDCEGLYSMLGRGDSASQREYFQSKKQLLAEKKAAAEKEAKARSGLYLKLGLLAGLAFVILIL